MPFHKLDVYRKAYELSLTVHRTSMGFPKFEQVELASQLRRSSKSICANIAEGMGRELSAKEVIRFLRMAMGSCDETRVWLEYVRDLGYMDAGQCSSLSDGYSEVARMLNGLIEHWRRRVTE